MYIKETIFWIGLLVINFSLFLLFTILNGGKNYLPLRSIFKKDKGIFQSRSSDFYRVSLDISILILATRVVTFPYLTYFITTYYIIIFIFSTYHSSFSYLYKVFPLFINDGRLIKNGIVILWSESKMRFLGCAIAIIGLIVLFGLGFSQFLIFSESLNTSLLFYFLCISFLSFCFLGALTRKKFYHIDSDLHYRIVIFPLRIFMNILVSLKLKKMTKKLLKLPPTRYHLKLPNPPNIYCLFVESYGSILLQEKKLSPYLGFFDLFCQNLKKRSWSITSNQSDSISLVGPSWVAYSSVLYGLKMEKNYEYDFIIENKSLDQHQTLLKALQYTGYQSLWLEPIKVKKGIRVPFDRLKASFGIDKWILQDDIPYRGTTYGIWDVPPDQYTLNYAYHHYLQALKSPYFLFYISKYSHSPFISPNYETDNWQSLNNGEQKTIGNRFLQIPRYEDYLSSIKYQLDVLQDFIVNKGKSNDLFLIIGDHQPHVISEERHSNKTIMHIIGKDKGFISRFDQYGFTKNAFGENPIRHEAILSMFLKEVGTHYGSKDSIIPNYQPHGIQF